MVTKRVQFAEGKQRAFFERVEEAGDLRQEEIAGLCGVSARTWRAWKCEENTAPHSIVKELSDQFDVPAVDFKALDRYWYTKQAGQKGGKARNKLHGNPGTQEGRSKGGRISQERRRQKPEKYKEIGCLVRNEFPVPAKSNRLAEMLGIILGDGSLSDSQLRVTLHRHDDREYAQHVCDLFRELFDEALTWSERNNVIELIATGINLVEILEDLGLQRGNKVDNQISIPNWVKDKKSFCLACVRGLFDTDGCIYYHHKESGTYIGWTYASRSRPLRDDVEEIMKDENLSVYQKNPDELYMYAEDSITKYMDIIGSNNLKHVKKYQDYKA